MRFEQMDGYRQGRRIGQRRWCTESREIVHMQHVEKTGNRNSAKIYIVTDKSFFYKTNKMGYWKGITLDLTKLMQGEII